MYIMTLVPLFIVLPLIAAAAWFFRHKIKDALRRCGGRVARARHSISSGGGKGRVHQSTLSCLNPDFIKCSTSAKIDTKSAKLDL